MPPTNNNISFEAYANIVHLSQRLDAEYDLVACLRAPKAPKGDNTTATVRPQAMVSR